MILKLSIKRREKKLIKLDLKLQIDNIYVKIYKYQLFINNLEHIHRGSINICIYELYVFVFNEVRSVVIMYEILQ
jgi:hypothetical protein